MRINGRSLSLASAYRKATYGIKGRDGKRHKIETEIGVSGGLVTTNEAVDRFIRDINTVAAEQHAPTKPAMNSKSLASAECDIILNNRVA